MKGIVSCILCVFSLSLLKANDGKYAVTRIPATLLKNAHAIKRMESISFEVINTGEAVLIKKYAITILNEQANYMATFSEYYDKLHDIRNVEGSLYDAEGRELKRLKNKQVVDLTGSDDDNLADDNRRKAHNFYYRVYPYTVEYEVTIRHHGTLFFPVWIPREEEYLAVEQSSFMLIAPASYNARYKAFNYNGDPVIATGEKNKRSMSWQVSHLPAIIDEYASPDWYEINTVVFTGPTDFEIENYKGNMSSWESFGSFVYSLKQGRDQLPPNIKTVVQQVSAATPDPRERTVRLYEYLQKNTRYISIQLGIGGWQPFDASYVASKSYGDCKALTNYMFSLLKEAGIPSLYTLVRAGRGGGNIIADFPAQQFNHVILCVPFEKDSMWLECTSQTLPAGYLGDHTADRYALLVTENGGKLVRTPRYSEKENLEIRHIKAVLHDDATLELDVKTRYTGLQQDRYHALINNYSKDKVKEVLHEQLDFATYDIRSFDYKEMRSASPAIDEKLDVVVSNYATITGKRIFIHPNIMTRIGRKLSPDAQRQFDIDLGFAYKDVDTVEIALPSGYSPEAMPKDVAINGKFGTYSCSVKLAGNKLIYYRTIEHYSGRFPAADYPELVKFYETIYKADRNRVVLVKNESP